jgi:S-formylglutathione hydrolase FrmB
MRIAQGAVSRRSFIVAAGASLASLVAGCSGAQSSEPSYKGVTPGPQVSGSFRSRYRHQRVGWTISYPPHHHPGERLDVALVLHGYNSNHQAAFSSLGLQYAQAQKVHGRFLPPIVLASVDGGDGYWHPRANGDDPQGMLIHEFLPLLATKGLNVQQVALLGWSMGGYGALLLAETYPHLVRRVAAESPAIWPSYSNSQGANPSAFDSANDWEDHDVIGHVARLSGIPTRIDEGESDPFLWASQRLQQLLPAGSVHFEPGAHDAGFWAARAPAQLQFLTADIPR